MDRTVTSWLIAWVAKLPRGRRFRDVDLICEAALRRPLSVAEQEELVVGLIGLEGFEFLGPALLEGDEAEAYRVCGNPDRRAARVKAIAERCAERSSANLVDVPCIYEGMKAIEDLLTAKKGGSRSRWQSGSTAACSTDL